MRAMMALGLVLLLFSTLLVVAGEPVPNVHATQETTQAAVAPGLLFGVADPTVFSGSNFYRINPSNGTATLIGSVGFTGVSGMAFDPFTGVLYARGRRLGGTEVLMTL